MASQFDAACIARNLPEEPPPGIMSAVLAEYSDELGGDLCVFSRVSWAPEDDGFGGPQWMEDPAPRQWAARCRCTACGTVWHSGWLDKKNGGPGIRLIQGPDGMTYPGVPEDADSEDVFAYTDGDETELVCPDCGAELFAVHAAQLRAGRKHQVLAATLNHAGKYTAVLFWTAGRRFDADGIPCDSVDPCAAAVVDDSGAVRLFRYDFGGVGGWRYTPGGADPEHIKYYSWEAVNHRKVGCVILGNFIIPPKAGETGEKTGVLEYLREGGTCPTLYLRFWQKFPSVENLVKFGWSFAVVTAIQAEDRRFFDRYPAGSGRRLPSEETALIADYGQSSPRKMLHMNRDEVRKGAEWRWDCDTLMTWQAVCCPTEGPPLMGPGDAAFFHRMVQVYGLDNIRRYSQPDEGGPKEYTLAEADRYLRRQNRVCRLAFPEAFRLFLDYREMLYALAENQDDFCPERLWPNRLEPAHDRIAEEYNAAEPRRIAAERKRIAAEQDEQARVFSAEFAAVARRWARLEWTDGEFCVRLPWCRADLIREGRVLRHCVGSYTTQHLSGKLVLFVRKARRPERCYFTLNEDVTGTAPHRIQLHGYRNEIGAKGQRLRVPDAVTAFVERWEREVLNPVFYGEQRVRVNVG